jgi:hypothetical protein
MEEVYDNKYKQGEIVYAIKDPETRLIIRRYIPRIYYCTVADDPSKPEIVYFERELMPEPQLTS